MSRGLAMMTRGRARSSLTTGLRVARAAKSFGVPRE
jgi:hypothetical protein